MQKTRSCDFAAPAAAALVFLVIIAPACQGVDKVGLQGDNGPGTSTTKSDAPVDKPGGTVLVIPDSGWSFGVDSGVYVPRSSCKVGGGQYCGIIGDGCTGDLNCGDCPTGLSCQGGVCGDGTGYDAGPLTSCVVTGGT